MQRFFVVSHRTEGLGDCRVGGEGRSALAGPVELVPLLRTLDDVIRQFLSEQVEVDRAHRAPLDVEGLRDDARKELREFLDVRSRQVG